MREIVIDTETTGLDPLGRYDHDGGAGRIKLTFRETVRENPGRIHGTARRCIQAFVRARPKPLPRVSLDDRNAHCEFVHTLDSEAIECISRVSCAA